MAAREFIIHFVNGTHFRLEKQSSPSYLQGEWTGGREPPAFVEPNATVQWMSESNGFWTGTEGEVAYRPLREDSGKYKDIAVIHWNNPYIGATDSAARVDLDNIPEPWGEAPTRSFALDGGGARDTGTFPGWAASGWIDLVPGVVPIPFPNDPRNINHAWAEFRLRFTGTSIIPSANEIAPVPEKTSFTYLPVYGAPSDAWGESWRSRDGQAVSVEIARHDMPWRTRFDVRVEEYFPHIFSHFQLRQTGVRETIVLNERYDRDFYVNPTVAATRIRSRTQSLLGDMIIEIHSFKPIAGATLKQPGLLIAGTTSKQPGLLEEADIYSKYDFTDALELPGNLCLCLYARTEHPSGDQDYSVRYLKRSSSGEILIDMMLARHYAIK